MTLTAQGAYVIPNPGTKAQHTRTPRGDVEASVM
jgi:hypothetical protein